jgi:hypothetical protein
MFCPRCSQQQSPGEVRFCVRCGFQLAAVSQLLNTNGISYIVPSQVPKERLPLIKRKELRTGAKFIFASFFMFVPCLILAGIFDNGIPLVLIPITFLLGLAQIFYYFFFGESILPVKKQELPFELSDNTHPYNFQPTYQTDFSYMDSNSVNTVESIPYGNSGRKTSNFYNER